jgi:SSS family solute:Na+ symporter
MTNFSLGTLDYAAFFFFFVFLSLVGYLAGRRERGSSTEYFLAGNRLPWYVIGSSLVASVNSTDHFIGMVGWTVLFGVSIGMWSWTLVTDLTLLIFIWVPFLLASRVFTIPEFLQHRFDGRVRLSFAVITILINVLNFMATVLYAGGVAIEQLFGWNVIFAIVILGIVAGFWSVYGGLSSVAWTDTFNLVIVLLGGGAVVYLSLNALGHDSLLRGLHVMLDRNRAEHGIWAQAVQKHQALFTAAPKYNRLSVLQPADHIAAPTLGLVLSSLSLGVWYNVMNQFVIQRVLGARNAYHARLGLVFSGLLSLALPFLIVIPGLVIFAMHPEILLTDWGHAQTNADRSYIQLIQHIMPIGIRGLFLAALFGAVQSTVNAVLNSTATIFTLDIYKVHINKDANEKKIVQVGVFSSVITLIVAIIIGILVSQSKISVFYYTQILNTFFAAPFAAIFVLGVLWRRMNSRGAIAALVLGFTAATGLKVASAATDILPRWADTILNQAGLVLVVSVISGVIASLTAARPAAEQISPALTFRWSNPILRTGFGHGIFGSVLTWWIVMLLLFGAIVAFFSPLVFK